LSNVSLGEDIDDIQDQSINISRGIQGPANEEWDSMRADIVEDDSIETENTSKSTRPAHLVREKIRKVLEDLIELAVKRAC
jgi:hypothetical protein